MNKMRKVIAISLTMIMILGVFAVTGCGKSDEGNDGELTGWKYVEDKGELIIGLDDTFAPMGFRDENNELVGFDIDLATAVGEELGVKITFKPIDWDSKDLELKAKTIDCIWNGMSVTDERKENMALTDMYLNNRIVVMALNKDVKIESEADLAKYKIGTQSDSSSLEVMQASATWETIKDNVSEYRTYDDAILDMKAGRVDCIAVDEVLGTYKNAKMDNVMSVCTFDFGDDFYAIGCRKADTDLAAKISEAIQATIDSGKAEEISNKWFGTNIVILKGYDE